MPTGKAEICAVEAKILKGEEMEKYYEEEFGGEKIIGMSYKEREIFIKLKIRNVGDDTLRVSRLVHQVHFEAYPAGCANGIDEYYFPVGYIPSEVSTPYSAFESFFGLAGPPLVYRQIYYTIAPILAVMAHAVTLCGDKASGYVKNLYIRSKRQDYYTAKYIVSGIAGGIAVTAPIAANFLWNLMMLPAIEPMASMAIYPYGIGLWSDVLYTNPYLFILLYILLIFFYQFIFVNVALILSRRVTNRFLVVILPFLLNYFFHMLVVNIRKYRLSPIVIFDMTNIRSLEFREVFAEGVLLVAVTSLLYFWQVKKDEALS